MNWTGGRLTNTATKFGISRKNALDFNSLDAIGIGINERASAIARCKRQQRQHFQKMARLKKAYKPELSYSRCGSGSSSPLVRKRYRKGDGDVDYSINQHRNDEKNDSIMEDGFVQLTNKELRRRVNEDGEERELIQLESSCVTSAQASPTPKESLADRKRALLHQHDWGSIFLTDRKRRCLTTDIMSQEWRYASMKGRAKEEDTKISTPKETISPSNCRPSVLGALKQRRHTPSTPFNMDYKARGFVSTSSSPYSALASSPTNCRGLGMHSTARLRTVTEDEDKDKDYAMQFGERASVTELGEYSSNHARAYDDSKYAAYGEPSTCILSSSVKPENSLGEFGSLKSSFSYSHNVQVPDTSFESLHTSGSFDQFEDGDGWKVVMASTSIADNTTSNSMTNNESEVNVSEDVSREWRELVGKQKRHLGNRITTGLDMSVTAGVHVQSSETDSVDSIDIKLNEDHRNQSRVRSCWRKFKDVGDPILLSGRGSGEQQLRSSYPQKRTLQYPGLVGN
ncbi:hypothetical protein V1508DRAFT_396145 [Lipomyces doorenjongii]|uniref:uncharacterized protein n=1 Tax=Lipomyces doorenjongii TaxID=383834 RepID=UPI0034CFF0DE